MSEWLQVRREAEQRRQREANLLAREKLLALVRSLHEDGGEPGWNAALFYLERYLLGVIEADA